MKVRYTVSCERCKVPIVVGSRATRLYGRIWHYECRDRYLAERAQRTVAA